MDIRIHSHIKSRKDPSQRCTVYLHHKSWKVATGLNVIPAYWDKKAKQFNSDCPDQKRLNQQLSDYKAYLKSIIAEEITFQKRKAEERRIELPSVNWSEVKRRFNIHIGKAEGKKINTVNNALVDRLNAKKKNGKRGTWKVYQNAINHFEGFTADKKWFFDEIDIEFYESFRDYLLDDKKLQMSYTINVLKKIKQLLKETASIKRYNNNNPLSYQVDFKRQLGISVRSNKKKPVKDISINEIKKLLSQDYKLEKTANARDALIMACLSGLRISDWWKIDLSTNTIKTVGGIDFALIDYNQKTKNSAVVPILNLTRELLTKHGGKFPKKVLGKEIKRAAREAGFIRNFEKHKEGRQIIIEVVPEWEVIKSSSGRHTFTTLCRSTGMPDDFINIMRGDSVAKNIIDVYDHRNIETRIKGAVPYLVDLEKELGSWNYEDKKLIAV